MPFIIVLLILFVNVLYASEDCFQQSLDVLNARKMPLPPRPSNALTTTELQERTSTTVSSMSMNMEEVSERSRVRRLTDELSSPEKEGTETESGSKVVCFMERFQ